MEKVKKSKNEQPARNAPGESLGELDQSESPFLGTRMKLYEIEMAFNFGDSAATCISLERICN
jgi:hypothetical protein